MLTHVLRFLSVIAGFLLLAACNQDSRIGQEERETKILELDKSELTRVELKMDAGELHVAGGSRKLMEADFDYNVPGWKPQVDYHSTGVRSDIQIAHATGAVPHGKSDWNLRFNDSVSMDLVVKMGAGQAHLNLGSMNLRSVAFDLGAGEVNVDLRGNPRRSYDVKIRRTGNRPLAEERRDLGHRRRWYRRGQRQWAGETQRPLDQSGPRERSGDDSPGREGRHRPDRCDRGITVRGLEL
jgi:hypothetical protein